MGLTFDNREMKLIIGNGNDLYEYIDLRVMG